MKENETDWNWDSIEKELIEDRLKNPTEIPQSEVDYLLKIIHEVDVENTVPLVPIKNHETRTLTPDEVESLLIGISGGVPIDKQNSRRERLDDEKMIKVVKTLPNATFQKFGGVESVGYDLTCVGIEIKKDGRIVLDLGIRVTPPSGFFFTLIPRSSFSKSGFVMANSIGIIDPPYTGIWMMVIRPITNITKEMKEKEVKDLFLNKRVSQAILRKVETKDVIFVDELSTTSRGENGFGSSGK